MVESIYRNPYRWRAVVNRHDVRHGTAGALLSVVLFAPLFVDFLGLPLLLFIVVVYSTIIVPAITNYYSFFKYLVPVVRVFANGGVAVTSWLHLGLCSSVKSVITRIYTGITNTFSVLFHTSWEVTSLALHVITVPITCFAFCGIPCLHQLYLAIEGIRITANQVIFMTLCERLLVPRGQLTSLYFLLFYTVLAYLHRSLVTRQWSQSLYATDMREFLKLTTWFIAVRLGKGVAMSFVLIMFSMQFNHVDPNMTFIASTFVYFLLTQKKWSGQEKIVKWTELLNLDILQDSEEFLVPLFMKCLPVIASAGILSRMASSYPMICSIGLYTNIFVPLTILDLEYRVHYSHNINILSKYRRAKAKELNDSGTCPVCLEEMDRGRVTPCGHTYHSNCLRRCLTLSNLCPLCKQII